MSKSPAPPLVPGTRTRTWEAVGDPNRRTRTRLYREGVPATAGVATVNTDSGTGPGAPRATGPDDATALVDDEDDDELHDAKSTLVITADTTNADRLLCRPMDATPSVRPRVRPGHRFGSDPPHTVPITRNPPRVSTGGTTGKPRGPTTGHGASQWCPRSRHAAGSLS